MPNGELTVWYCRMPAERVPAALLDDLPMDQALRLGQMTRGPARQMRLLAWWLRNRLLAGQLGVPPVELALDEGPHGKPLLAGGELHFNLSHTGGCVAVACAPLAVGIDVEARQRQADWSGVARRMFSPAERAALEALPAARRASEAACLWSAREAWSKAGGRGVAGFADDPPFVWADGCWQAPRGRFWQTELPGHVLSVAVPEAGTALRLEACELGLRAGPHGWQAQRRRRQLKESVWPA